MGTARELIFSPVFLCISGRKWSALLCREAELPNDPVASLGHTVPKTKSHPVSGAGNPFLKATYGFQGKREKV